MAADDMAADEPQARGLAGRGLGVGGLLMRDEDSSVLISSG